MESNHKLTFYVSYYLPRFNDEAVAKLKYATSSNAFEDIEQRLNVKPHSVKTGGMSLILYLVTEQVGVNGR